MKFEVYHAAPVRVGWDLYRIGVNLYNEKNQLLLNYEVWATYEAIQDGLRISRSPTHEDLVQFGTGFLQKRLEENPSPSENGAYVSSKGIHYGQHETFPGSLEGIDPSIQTNIILPSSLHEWAKIESVKSKLSLSEIIRLGLLEYRVKTITRDKFVDLFNSHEELEELVNSIFDKKHEIKGLKDGFLSFVLAKAYKMYRAIIILCELGYGEDAAQLVRSLFDLLITTLYIMKDPTDEKVRRFFEYDWIIRKKIYEYAKTKPYLREELEKRSKNLREGEDSIDEVFKSADEAQKNYKYNNISWSDKSIREMAEKVGRIDAYHTVYSLQSNIAHSSARTMNDYVKPSEDGGFIVDIAPGFNWVEECLVASFDFFHTIVGVFNKHFGLKLDESLDQIAKRYIAKVGKINEVSESKDS